MRTATYVGSPFHKRSPGDFGLIPPAAPRPDKTLCDEADITSVRQAQRLFCLGVQRELVSEATTSDGYPKEFWAVDEDGNVFEAMHTGSTGSCYHGYPIRASDPLAKEIRRAWNA